MPKRQHSEDPAEGSREIVERELSRTGNKSDPKRDAEGQSEKNHKGGDNSGVSSADPRVFSGKESGDATFPLKQDRPKSR